MIPKDIYEKNITNKDLKNNQNQKKKFFFDLEIENEDEMDNNKKEIISKKKNFLKNKQKVVEKEITKSINEIKDDYFGDKNEKKTIKSIFKYL